MPWARGLRSSAELPLASPTRAAIALHRADEGETMRRLAGLLLILVTGCSTSPVADFLDYAFPPKQIPPNTPGTFGGVGGTRPARPEGAELGVPVPLPENR